MIKRFKKSDMENVNFILKQIHGFTSNTILDIGGHYIIGNKHFIKLLEIKLHNLDCKGF